MREPFSSPIAIMLVSGDTCVLVILLLNGHTMSGLNSISVNRNDRCHRKKSSSGICVYMKTGRKTI